ncbi:MAG TPA: glycosyltransferase family 4 protein [Solirubrobacteraceae bacterium]|jgi:glycosyltransferase involved in cell wall biosynthesis|nr:glycosyltransferase family 4 protein [Solirubrobacteraceae bacterium]
MTVHHFGPDPATVGGMASVIRVFSEHHVGGDAVEFHPTWRPNASLTSARLAGAATRVLRRLPAGEVAHIHLSEKGSFVREGALVALARRRGLVTVASIHGGEFVSFAARRPRLVAAVLGRAHLVTCLARETLQCVNRRVPDVHAELVPNPVPVDRDAPPADATEELVVFAGEISTRKGADVLHRAWQLVAERRPTARCVLVGPIIDYTPPPAPRLQVRAPVGPAEVRELLRAARVVVLAAQAEALPMILSEAMSAGRPFVATPVGGVTDLLASGGGVPVAVGDHRALADRLTELLADPTLARQMGERGREFCERNQSVDVIDARLRELYAAAAPAAPRQHRGPDGPSDPHLP